MDRMTHENLRTCGSVRAIVCCLCPLHIVVRLCSGRQWFGWSDRLHRRWFGVHLSGWFSDRGVRRVLLGCMWHLSMILGLYRDRLVDAIDSSTGMCVGDGCFCALATQT